MNASQNCFVIKITIFSFLSVQFEFCTLNRNKHERIHVSLNFILLYTVGLFSAKKQRVVAIIGFKLRNLTYNIPALSSIGFTADLVGLLVTVFQVA